jgi:hypothetical protein
VHFYLRRLYFHHKENLEDFLQRIKERAEKAGPVLHLQPCRQGNEEIDVALGFKNDNDAFLIRANKKFLKIISKDGELSSPKLEISKAFQLLLNSTDFAKMNGIQEEAGGVF